jgi:uncharacterized membrane protein YozB (DUF420 family)
MLTGWTVVLILKIAVVAVTALLLTSLVALARGHYRLHGRINLVFFTLTLTALLSLEVVAHFLTPSPMEEFLSHEANRQALRVHLVFSVPAAVVMPAMLYTGLTRRRTQHLMLAALFSVLWIGTFVTGVFFLPHTP